MNAKSVQWHYVSSTMEAATQQNTACTQTCTVTSQECRVHRHTDHTHTQAHTRRDMKHIMHVFHNSHHHKTDAAVLEMSITKSLFQLACLVSHVCRCSTHTFTICEGVWVVGGWGWGGIHTSTYNLPLKQLLSISDYMFDYFPRSLFLLKYHKTRA